MHRFTCSQQVHRCTGTEVHRCRGAEVQRWCRGAEEEVHRCAEVQMVCIVTLVPCGAKWMQNRCRGDGEEVMQFGRCRDGAPVQVQRS